MRRHRLVRRSITVIATASVIALLIPSEAFGGITSDWIRRWSSPYAPHTVVAVAQGRVYATSWMDGLNRQILRAFTPKGRFLWSRALPRMEVNDAAADETGVYLVGGSLGPLTDAMIVRVLPFGNTAWVRRLAGTEVTCPIEEGSCDREMASAVVLAKHAVFVTGETETRFAGQRFAGERDGFVATYSMSGRMRWIRQFGTPRIDQPIDIAEGRGRVYVVGETWGDRPGITPFVRAFRLDGARAWGREPAWLQSPSVVTVVGRTLIVGGERYKGPRGAQIVLAGFGLKGRMQWTRGFWGSPKNDWLSGVVTLGSRAVFTGGTEGSFADQHQGKSDVIVFAVRQVGRLAWALQDGSRSYDSGTSIATLAGDLFVGGTASGKFLGSNGGSGDAFALRMPAP